MNSALVLGIGNVLCGDDGAGCRVAEYLYATTLFDDNVSILDGGTLGQELLEPISRASRLLIIDSVDFGLRPGDIINRDASQIPVWLGVNKMSPHQGCFAEVLALAELKNSLPEAISLLGIQPQGINFGEKLSPLIASKIPLLAEKCKNTLKQWGHDCFIKKERSYLNVTDLALQNYEPEIPIY